MGSLMRWILGVYRYNQREHPDVIAQECDRIHSTLYFC